MESTSTDHGKINSFSHDSLLKLKGRMSRQSENKISSSPDHGYVVGNFQAALFAVHKASSSSNIEWPLQKNSNDYERNF